MGKSPGKGGPNNTAVTSREKPEIHADLPNERTPLHDDIVKNREYNQRLFSTATVADRKDELQSSKTEIHTTDLRGSTPSTAPKN